MKFSSSPLDFAHVQMPLSSCAKDIHIVPKFLCECGAPQNRLDSLLCTAILGCSGNLGLTLGLWPWVMLCSSRQLDCACAREVIYYLAVQTRGGFGHGALKQSAMAGTKVELDVLDSIMGATFSNAPAG